MENKGFKFTDLETGFPVTIYREDVETYRGNSKWTDSSEYTTIYLKNGEVKRVREDFDEVDKILDL